MAFTNFETREIHCKVLYFGCSGSGKTANLRSVFSATSSEVQAGFLELQAEGGPTPYFDFLPLSLGQIGDFNLRLHLFTLPLNTLYQTVPSVILKGIDGYVFVADARLECLSDNVTHLQLCRKKMVDEGLNIADIPYVIQYNKKDLPGAMSTNILRQQLNPSNAPDFESVANKGIGVLEPLECLSRLMTERMEQNQK